MPFKMLDCFCGMGGVSDGFAMEGFDITGIDIVDAPNMLGYKHPFILGDMLLLKGEDFKGYDVIWGSPPCRDFSSLAKWLGKTWKKNPPNPQKGLELVNCFLKFVENAKPQIWIMENVYGLKNYLELKPRIETYITKGKRHCFWGNFPNCSIPRYMITYYTKTGKQKPLGKLGTWIRAKIPLGCSRAFAKACKEALLNAG